ncbi:regulatory protein RecX [Oleispirillum naphthae]|uniref:regulatory protein RecX n=1 Tax=Oleispirillum naphthae TaxID=2838853 RepID=UPI0030824C72
MSATQPPKSRRAALRRITAASLENAALYYLQRFDGTAAHLRRVLQNKVRRAAAHPQAEVDTEAAQAWIDAAVAKMLRLGYIDDARTARSKARGLYARGTPPAAIRRRLAAAGVGAEDAEAALATLSEEEGENRDLTLAAALTLARRRRLGPFRAAAERQDRRDKDLAALGRAGFDYDTARRVIDAPDAEALEEEMS